MRENPDYYYHQSAVVPVRFAKGEVEVLMITSRSGKRWVVPKGIIEPHLSPEESAAKEAEEEAGILGTVLPGSLGSFEYEKWGGSCSVQVFVMQVTEVKDVWLENFRSRAWLTLEDAMARIKEQALRDMIETLPMYLKKMKF